MIQNLEGKTALVTGAGKGLGKAVTLALVKEGVNVLLIGRKESDLLAVKAEASTINSEANVQYALADVSDYGQVKNAVEYLTGLIPQIDILLNNAGIFKFGGILEVPVNEWEQVFKTNVFGAYYVTREVLPFMLQSGKGGNIMNIASTSGLKGAANMNAYGPSKAALINFTESLMQEVRKHNIRVTTINPSTIATDMTLSAKFTDGNPDRVLQPEDLAHLVVSHLKLPQRAFVKEVSLWSTNP